MSLRRRDLLAAGAALALPSCRRGDLPRTLVPDTPCPVPSYFSTWGLQRAAESDPARWQMSWKLPSAAADRLTEPRVFGPEGWAQSFKPVHSDLNFLLDLGWDMAPATPFETEPWRLGSLEVSSAKFPSCTGTPADRLAKLVDRVKMLGWRGLGVRVAAQVHGAGRDGGKLSGSDVESHFRTQLRAAHLSGVGYWKVDSPGNAGVGFRRILSTIAYGEAPNLALEHTLPWDALNDQMISGKTGIATGSGRFRTWSQGQWLESAVEVLGFSRVFRTNEATAQLSIPTTLDRVADLLMGGGGARGNDCIINCEDEVYMAAALGCSMAIMRHPSCKDPLLTGSDPRLLRSRSIEVIRALKWLRIAPPYPVGYTKTNLHTTRLDDDWRFKTGETPFGWVEGMLVRQGAPSIVARNSPLPKVESQGSPPYVVTSKHPNGATAIATLPRAFAGRGFVHPEVDVTLEVEDPAKPIGIFGRYRSLTLDLIGPPLNARVMAQDLASSEAVDVTDRVNLAGSTLVLPGELINQLGGAAGPRGDQSDPGLVLQIFRV